MAANRPEMLEEALEYMKNANNSAAEGTSTVLSPGYDCIVNSTVTEIVTSVSDMTIPEVTKIN